MHTGMDWIENYIRLVQLGRSLCQNLKCPKMQVQMIWYGYALDTLQSAIFRHVNVKYAGYFETANKRRIGNHRAFGYVNKVT
jgi:hypothetical protein